MNAALLAAMVLAIRNAQDRALEEGHEVLVSADGPQGYGVYAKTKGEMRFVKSLEPPCPIPVGTMVTL